jgi:hypothetical protein
MSDLMLCCTILVPHKAHCNGEAGVTLHSMFISLIGLPKLVSCSLKTTSTLCLQGMHRLSFRPKAKKKVALLHVKHHSCSDNCWCLQRATQLVDACSITS